MLLPDPFCEGSNMLNDVRNGGGFEGFKKEFFKTLIIWL